MSQAAITRIDPASHPDAAAAARFIELRTAHVRPSDRLTFWRDTVLRCMEPICGPDEGRPFAGRMRRIITPGAELVEHASESIVAIRTADRCRLDSHDEICVDAMIDCSSAWMDQDGERRLGRRTLCVLDFARPIRVRRPRHRAIGVFLPRQRVREALGGDRIDQLAGRRLATSGMATLLQSHLRTVLDEAPRLSPEERRFAVTAAAEMALAVLQVEYRGIVDAEFFKAGYYQAARRVIERDFADPDLTPLGVARMIGCSRSSLYRIFAREGESVATVIWYTRLDHAQRMLASDTHRGMSVSDIAFRTGFVEQPSFNRMFKRRFGVTPRDLHGLGIALG